VLGRSESLKLPRRSPALRVLQQARDEAHRFAITFQRKRRAARTITSELMRLPGVGESKRRQLLAAFGSLQGVREATVEQIAELPGFGRKSAEKIVELLRANSPTAPARRVEERATAESADELVGPLPAEPPAKEPELVQLGLAQTAPPLSDAPASELDQNTNTTPSIPEHP